MAKSPEDMANAMIANMKEKTGKTLEQWIAIARKSGEEKHGAIVKHLKSGHGMTHGYANLVAHKTLKSDAGSSSGTFVAGEKITQHELKPGEMFQAGELQQLFSERGIEVEGQAAG